KTALSVTDDQVHRFEACGWRACRIDGHNFAAIDRALAWARGSDRPSMIACRTVIGYGAPTKQGTAATHGEPLGAEEIRGARAHLGWAHAPFAVPAELLAAWRAAGARGGASRRAWQQVAAKLKIAPHALADPIDAAARAAIATALRGLTAEFA